jgi:outer membrane protein insertion porin family
LHFKIQEGPKVYASTIIVEGNTYTKDYVILREINIDIGDVLTPTSIEEARKRLQKLAIFSRVEIRTLEANTDKSQRTLIVSVTERNPGLFKLGFGATNKQDITLRGYSGLSYNNIAGTARAVSLRGTVENNLKNENLFQYEASIGYLEPFLFDKRLRGRASYSRSEKIPESQASNLYATDSINFAVEKDFTSKIKFSWLLWGFDSVEQFTIPSSGPLQRDSRQEIAYIGPSLDIDYTDNVFLPTEGTYTKFGAEYSAPDLGSSDKIEFVRTQARFKHYLRVGSPKVIWANSISAGYVKNLSREVDSGVPFTFAFFLGGYSTVRGYTGSANDSIPNSIDFPVPRDNTNQLIIPGESTFHLFKSELRFPLPIDPLGGVIFYDAGEVDIQGVSINNPLKQSVGIGFRVNTPVGPISIDYAKKLNTTFKGESPDQWHISIGTF